MSVLVGVASARQPADGLARALQRAVRRFTWRTAGMALLIGLAFDAWSFFDAWHGESPYQGYSAGLVVNLLMALALTGAAIIADELIVGGGRPLPTYVVAVVAGSAVATAVYWMIHSWIPAPQSWPEQPLPPATVSLRIFLEYLIWGAIGAAIYAHHRATLRAAAHLNAAQLAAAASRRVALESRLQAVQARVEPQFLSRTLLQIRDTYDRDAAAGARLLDQLILYLRASLSHPEEPGLTLAQELSRVQAYFAIVMPRIRVAPCPSGPALSARLPAMILLPLCECLAPAAGDAGCLRIDAAVADGRLRLSVEISSAVRSSRALDPEETLQAVRRRLRDLYGDRAVVRAAAPLHSLEISLPYETSQRTDS
jgi:Histidine kinase